MNYFFLPRVRGLRSELTLTNFACVDGVHDHGPLRVYVAWVHRRTWEMRECSVLAPGDAVTLGDSALPSDLPAEVAPCVLMHPHPLDRQVDRLPDLPIMRTQPAWRGNIRLRGAGSAVSYQGEYPADMAANPAGTLLSISTLAQHAPNLSNQLIFMNICREPITEERSLRFAVARDCRVLKDASVWTNRCTVVELDDLQITPPDILVVASRNTTGIPLFLSRSVEDDALSLEHTHPPMEFSVFGDRIAAQRDMKSRWLKRLYP